MDAQELRNLQEAYMEVVENQQLDEANRGDEHVTSSMYMSREPETTAAKVRRRQIRDGLPNNASHQGDDKDYDRQFSHQVSRGRKKLKAQSSETLEGNNKDKNTAGKYAGMQRRKRQGLSYEEQVDIYDIILSHLLDEGYAETPEAAKAIMVNMSEEWRYEIIDEAQIMSVSGKGGLKYMINPKIVRAQNAAARERQGRQERENQAKDAANVERSAQARKASIQRLNAKPGADSGDYDSGYHGDDDTSGGKRHYSLSRTDRNARKRRASGR